MMMDCGILYMVSGDRFVDEARRSAESVNQHMPDTPVAIATDTDTPGDVFDIVLDYDFRTETVNGRDWLINSTIPRELSPFDRTLYLDSDTLVLGDVTCLFDLLSDYDLAVARPTGQPPTDGLPEPWRHLNCGVIAYADTAATRQLLDDWRRRYQEDIQTATDPVDQPSFVRALHDSNVRWFCLPPEYNVRVPQRGALTAEAKIVHGRHPAGLERAAAELNRSDRPRVYRERSFGGRSVFEVRDRGTIRYHARQTLSNYGPRTLLSVGGAWVLDRLDGGDRMSAYGGLDLG